MEVLPPIKQTKNRSQKQICQSVREYQRSIKVQVPRVMSDQPSYMDCLDFTDQSYIMQQSDTLSQKISQIQAEMMPLKEELKELESMYFCKHIDTTIMDMEENRCKLELEKSKLDDELKLCRRRFSPKVMESITEEVNMLKKHIMYVTDQFQIATQKVEDMKQEHERVRRSDRYQAVLSADKYYDDLCERYDRAVHRESELLRILVDVSSPLPDEAEASLQIRSYQASLQKIQHQNNKMRVELVRMEKDFKRDKQELLAKIEEKKRNERRIKKRDNWRNRLNIPAEEEIAPILHLQVREPEPPQAPKRRVHSARKHRTENNQKKTNLSDPRKSEQQMLESSDDDRLVLRPLQLAEDDI